ncbi:glutathione S-transferase T3-like [Arabidopsis lyrata subsp. lyrata]|uniref:glutathione S-transferase T3-like n=1 Tax=Arabidopsis lyrata subsp. lyrata TaxID=81972 RepID=UPI000A29D520|nr:glutathione S-transferase T3-like [Arabidopsis lyrata subsp. lyrata]XP_020889044.1 glutathione S-transferase T3-like [Arabidopsis lyrata subsp. lyrata]XP_020889045.1 glutathione S-transferase T3-like [Arabidopsis lyrata subsp. lyrata]XP_020889046.1 glutathione S-transferase T3-like [Arabidopsis lyrata subsp. lyrata]XP_020889047.1 glutathione S-transferase T3-like [Arabidopsis lyrata subsp. lyrata]|eukprot:XP_020889043.1 glutathione S-transferase T3-like [Arabidopsis lyrata subsp. lyrata]
METAIHQPLKKVNKKPHAFIPILNESESPSIVVGESEVSVFSIQWSEAPSQGENNNANRIPRKRNKLSRKKDVVLISAWLNTSKDAIVGNEQRGDVFRKRIAAYFAGSPQVSCLKKRLPSHFKQRWGKINENVCKFLGSHQAATTQMASGQNDNDLMKLVHQICESDYKKKFTMDSAWRELRHDQNWCASQSIKETVMSKRKKAEDGAAHSSGSNPISHGGAEASQTRPPGVKAAKGKGKRNANNSPNVEGERNALERIQSLWEIKLIK